MLLQPHNTPQELFVTFICWNNSGLYCLFFRVAVLTLVVRVWQQLLLGFHFWSMCKESHWLGEGCRWWVRRLNVVVVISEDAVPVITFSLPWAFFFCVCVWPLILHRAVEVSSPVASLVRRQTLKILFVVSEMWSFPLPYVFLVL